MLVGQGFKVHVPDPQALVALGTVLIDGLHAFAEGLHPDVIDPADQIGAVLLQAGLYFAGCALCSEAHPVYRE